MREQIHSNWGGSWCCFVKFPPWFSFRPLGENRREVPRGQNWEKRGGDDGKGEGSPDHSLLAFFGKSVSSALRVPLGWNHPT